jgi:Glycosyl transferases group 1
VKPSWPLQRELVRRLTISWPARYAWPAAHNWLRSIETGLRSYPVTIERRDVPQPATSGAVLLEVGLANRRERIAVDYTDTSELDTDTADSVLLYFKMNHAASGYGLANVVPGGYVCGNPDIYRRLLLLRALRGRPRFAWDVYGRFGLRFEAELRRRAFEILSGRDDFRYEGNLFRYPGGPEKVPYPKYLLEITRAKVCVDMPGGGGLTFRLVDYLALGACVVRPRGRVGLHVPLVDGQHIAYCSADLSDLGDVCARLIRDDGERERIARNGRDYFDHYLHRRQLAAYYLSEICGRLAAV